MQSLTIMPSNLGRLKELTRQLLNEESMIATFFQLCPDMLCIIDADWRIIQISDSWQKYLCWSEDQLVSEHLITLIRPDDILKVQRILSSLKKSDKIIFHCRFKKMDSDEFVPLEWNMMLADDGNIYASARIIPEECFDCKRVQY